MPTSKSFVMPRSIKILLVSYMRWNPTRTTTRSPRTLGRPFKRSRTPGVRIAVLSDIHVDIRSAFERAGLLSLIDLFVLSFEHGVQSRGLRCFGLRSRGLNLPATQVLMVGDRAAYDGRPSGKAWSHCCCRRCARSDCRLHLVTALLG
jgi:FMN phosphatase YigB (HAD superfamily)